MANLLSYRIGNPKSPVLPLERVRNVGIPHVEINLAPDECPQEAADLLQAYDLRAATITSPCPLADDGVFDIFENYCAKAAVLGCTGIFTSVKVDSMPLETAYERLRRMGDIAARHGVKVGMETHPDLCENGGKAAETMSAIGHPNVGVNYDTANVYYYNHGVDTVEEVAKAAPYVVSVHLKDTMGGYHDGSFPRFGEGVVDFPRVFEVLNAQGFTGPFTIELEGPLTHGETDDENQAHVKACVDHLRALGLVP